MIGDIVLLRERTFDLCLLLAKLDVLLAEASVRTGIRSGVSYIALGDPLLIEESGLVPGGLLAFEEVVDEVN